MRLLAIAIFALIVAGCQATTKSAWEHYDACSLETSSFTKMVECGKQRRQAYCQPNGGCSAIGNSLVQYADSLATSVKRREMTEAEATRRWIEFKVAQQNNSASLAMQSAAIAAASAPRTCMKSGAVINCF